MTVPPATAVLCRAALTDDGDYVVHWCEGCDRELGCSAPEVYARVHWSTYSSRDRRHPRAERYARRGYPDTATPPWSTFCTLCTLGIVAREDIAADPRTTGAPDPLQAALYPDRTPSVTVADLLAEAIEDAQTDVWLDLIESEGPRAARNSSQLIDNEGQ